MKKRIIEIPITTYAINGEVFDSRIKKQKRFMYFLTLINVILFCSSLYFFSFCLNGEVVEEKQKEIIQVSTTNADVEPNVEALTVPDEVTGEFKTYMDYRTITSRSSIQWQLQQQANTNEVGLREIEGRVLVAVGTHYAEKAGQILRIHLDTGIVFEAIVGDIKQDKHTDETNRYVVKNGNIVEFIVDKNKINNTTKVTGDVSYCGYEGKVIKIEKLEGGE